MRIELAEKLLIKIMEWPPEEVQRQRPLLQALANFKYDEYHHFSPGMRFIESLVRWLKQFKTIKEKKIAYEFIISHLIFISGEQVSHLVSLAFTEKVRPVLIERTATEIDVDQYAIRAIVNSEVYRRNKRQVLFIGLSDGSKIDQFRRASRINNEQVYSTYDISPEKIEDMIKELTKDEPSAEKFNTIFLIDDFTASGISYCRESKGVLKGKVFKFLNHIYDPEDKGYKNYRKLVDADNLTLSVLFYIATRDALNYISRYIDKWKDKNNINLAFSVDAIQLIETDALISKEFIGICADEDYFDSSIIDRHYTEGNHEKPYLGFNECALPLILNHNTPNNSLPIFWLQDDKKFIGLFPRVTRHKK